MSELLVRWMPRASDEEFDVAAPLLEMVAKATHGEYTIDDLRIRAKDGRVLVAVAMRDSQPVMAWAIEEIRYPQVKSLNIMAIGGRDLRAAMEAAWPTVVEFAKSCGASFIEASCSRAMARLLKKSGFEATYTNVRFPLC